MTNIIKIIPGLYIGKYQDIDFPHIDNLNIKNIISINTNLNNPKYNELNININYNSTFINSNSSINIDFETINKFILNSYMKNESILIYEENIILPFIITIGFVIKYLNLTLVESLYGISSNINLNINMVPKNLIFELFNYYKQIHKKN